MVGSAARSASPPTRTCAVSSQSLLLHYTLGSRVLWDGLNPVCEHANGPFSVL